MKQKSHSCVLLFVIVFLFTSSHITARILAIRQAQFFSGEGELAKLDVIADEDSPLKMESTDSLDKLMGLEECENEDKECFNRRILAEAHLDYIYTQHHKGP
ncbi:hypothetical protein ACH5RR_009748 [Cinchona calisaya]|uniref:Phytosulfokine n=1 Tax=Cinchona calisaya TaxID=153742 RepID=A0ABD3AH79_9GENT